MLFIDAGVEYAIKVLSGETDGVVVDDAAIRETLQASAEGFSAGINMTVANHVENGTPIDNHYLVMADFVTF